MKKSLNSAKSLMNEKIDRLIALSLNKGVQPEELATNIFENPYESIIINKTLNNILVELIFSEDDSNSINKIVKIKYVYTYSIEGILLKIECIIDNKRKTEWDRIEIEKDLIKSIIAILKKNKWYKDLNKFTKSLPKDLQMKIIELAA